MLKFISAVFFSDSGDEEVVQALSSRRLMVSCLALLGVIYFGFLWTYPLIDRDEGFHVGTAAEMLSKGDWIVPTINDEHFFHKPVLIYWITMPSLMVFGHNEFAARLPSAICMFLLILLFRMFLRRITRDDAFSNACTLSMGLCPMYVIVARTALTDGPLLLFLTTGLLAFFMALEEDGRGDFKWYMLFWLCLGLGFLAKGPVAPAVMAPAAGLYALFRRKVLQAALRSWVPLGLLIFVAVNFWYILMVYRIGNPYIEGFFVNQIFRRGTKVLVSRGGGPLYYLVVFLVAGVPFSAIFMATFWQPLRLWRERREADPMGRLAFFAAISAVMTYLVFSAAATKLPHYVMPAFPWLCVLAVHYVRRLSLGEPAGRVVPGIVKFLSCALPATATLVVILFPIAVPYALDFALKIMKPDSGEYALPMETPLESYFVFPLAVVTLIMAIHPLRMFRKGRPYKALGSMIACMLMLLPLGLIYGSMGVNAVALQGKIMFEDVGKHASPGAEIATYGLWKQSMSFYTRRKLERYRYKDPKDLESLGEALRKPVPVYVLTRTRVLERLGSCGYFVPIRQYDGYFLGGNASAKKEFESSGR